jgi:hypothetical protein
MDAWIQVHVFNCCILCTFKCVIQQSDSIVRLLKQEEKHFYIYIVVFYYTSVTPKCITQHYGRRNCLLSLHKKGKVSC